MSNFLNNKEKYSKLQKNVIFDDSKEIKVLKGRRAGASTLALMLSLEVSSTLYVTKSRLMENNFFNKTSFLLEEEDHIKILKKEKGSSISSIIFFNYLTQKTHTLYITNIGLLDCTSYFFEGRKKLTGISKIIFDEIGPNEEGRFFFEDALKPDQVYFFFDSTFEDASWHIAPSFCNPSIKQETIKDLKENFNPETFREEIMAGLGIPLEDCLK